MIMYHTFSIFRSQRKRAILFVGVVKSQYLSIYMKSQCRIFNALLYFKPIKCFHNFKFLTSGICLIFWCCVIMFVCSFPHDPTSLQMFITSKASFYITGMSKQCKHTNLQTHIHTQAYKIFTCWKYSDGDAWRC